MAGGKTNTQRIEDLEGRVVGISARFDAFEMLIEKLDEQLRKYVDASEEHRSKITIVEQQLIIVDLKSVVAWIVSAKETLVAIKKDIENLQSWKGEQKKEKDEAIRRWWSFGPNITAALIGGFITIVGVAVNVGLTYYLNRQR